MNIGIIGDELFDNEELFEKVLSSESITSIAHDTKGRFNNVISRFIGRHHYPSCSLKNVDKVLVFYGGTDTRLIDRMKSAQNKGYKIKLIKYNLI